MNDSTPAPVALVTGAGRGIGHAMAIRLGGSGYRVVAVDVDLQAARATADAVGGEAFAGDVADPAANQAMVAHALDACGRLDALLLNAGIRSEQDAALPLDVEGYRRVCGVNMDSVVFGVDAGMSPLADSGGSVLVTASLAGLDPTPANPIYAMAKSATVAYVRAMAAVLATKGVRINVLCPGFTDTAILGIGGKLMRKQGFPLLAPDAVAEAAVAVLRGDGTGEAWSVIAGRVPAPFQFTPIDMPLRPDGSEARLRPFVAARP